MIKFIKWANKQVTNFTGRNGYFMCTGVEVIGVSQTSKGDSIMISPVTSKGNIGRCDISIPVSAVPDMVKLLQDMVLEYEIGTDDNGDLLSIQCNYECKECNRMWKETYSRAVDSDCYGCNKTVSPYYVVDLAERIKVNK